MVEDHSTVFVLLAGNLEHISHPLIECHLLLVFPLMTSLTDHGDFLLTCWAGPQRLGRKKKEMSKFTSKVSKNKSNTSAIEVGMSLEKSK